MVRARNLTLSFSSESSIEEELKRESTADAITIVVSHFSDNDKIDYLIVYGFSFYHFTFVLSYICYLSFFYHNIFQISYLVMFGYISLTLGDTPRLSSFYISSKVNFVVLRSIIITSKLA